MARDGTVWTARIYVRDGNDSLVGSREIRSGAPQCESMLDAVALAGAIAIDPEAAFRSPPPTAAAPTPSTNVTPVALSPTEIRAGAGATPTPPERPLVTRPVPTPVPQSTAPTRATKISASFRAVAAFGLLPVPAVGFALSAHGQVTGPVGWSAGAIWFPEVGTPPPAAGDISQYAFGITAGWLAGCGELIRGERMIIGGCGGLLAGAIHSVVYNLEPITPGDRPWFAISIGPRARLRLLGPLIAEVGIDAMVPLVRYRFAARSALPDGETIFQQTAVAVSAWAAVGVGF